MKENAAKAWENFRYWKMVYWKLGVKSLRVGLVTLYGSTNAVNWPSLHASERFVIISAALVAVLDVWDGFFDQTIAQLKAGREAGQGTDTWRRQQIALETAKRQPENG